MVYLPVEDESDMWTLDNNDYDNPELSTSPECEIICDTNSIAFRDAEGKQCIEINVILSE